MVSLQLSEREVSSTRLEVFTLFQVQLLAGPKVSVLEKKNLGSTAQIIVPVLDIEVDASSKLLG